MRLIDFPLLISVSFIALVFYPLLAKCYLRNLDEFKKNLVFAMQAVMVLGLAASNVLFIGTTSYIELVYGQSLKGDDLALVTDLVSIGLIGLPFQGGILLLISAFNSAGKTNVPLLINFVGAIFLFGILYFFLHIMSPQKIMTITVSVYIFIACVYSFLARKWLGQMKSYMLFYFFICLVNSFAIYFHKWLLSVLDIRVLGGIGLIVLFTFIIVLLSISAHPYIYRLIKKRVF
jgi:peptidoglycan biosynthesis protein MviN/MurJ (putative lipid II flippase)